MKILTVIVVSIILLLCLFGGILDVGQVIGNFGALGVLRLLLSSVGIVSFILYLNKKKIFAWLNALWFFPQTIVLVERTINPGLRTYMDYPIYDMSIAFKFCISMMWEMGRNTYGVLNVNLFALVGLILCLCIAERTLHKNLFLGKRKQQV